jgi:UDP-N-acetylglucosamine 1-carboxyvinyltransferase
VNVLEKIFVRHSPPLKGEVTISTCKNAILPIMAASLLTDDEVVIENIPILSDVFAMSKVLQNMGSKIRLSGNAFIIDNSCIRNCEALQASSKALRASFLVMGPLLSKYGCGRLPLPGGCKIGQRPVDLHLKGLSALGANAVIINGMVDARAKGLKGAEICMDFPSVGATENILCAACLAHGETQIVNAAQEPEIEDLANFLISMGARIEGAGTSIITIEGQKKLHGTQYSPIPDRIEAGTMVIAALITGGDVLIKNIIPSHLQGCLCKLSEAGAILREDSKGLRVLPSKKLKGTEVYSSPYPGFPTDLQPQFAALATQMEGSTIITETVFENRFMYADELNLLGAQINVQGRTAIVTGKSALSGAIVKATDLRAGAALIISGLAAQGVTEICEAQHLERGYEALDQKLAALGARIRCV